MQTLHQIVAFGRIPQWDMGAVLRSDHEVPLQFHGVGGATVSSCGARIGAQLKRVDRSEPKTTIPGGPVTGHMSGRSTP